MTFILGRKGKEDRLLARVLWFLMLILFVANIAFSMDALKQNAEIFQSTSGYNVQPVIANGWMGLALRAVICTATSGFCWIIVKTYVTSPFGLALVVQQIFAIKAEQGIKIVSMIFSLLILVLLGSVLFFAYRFDLLTTSVGMGIPISWNLMNNPMAFAVLMPVFGPEVISVALNSGEGIDMALGAGPSGGVGRTIGGGHNGMLD
ncbi:hypothetical protein [Nodosilinea nodulosa]|uniref:hypothetical protein n=1 Tax=Nodosilinea nodulosa TaxID=416001 RepID=UPI0003033AB1|nr:hypothetical protein [Nodosilinea nodulosa]